eukprot:jgi/Galph1/1526/GphlegSOOS_G203.1
MSFSFLNEQWRKCWKYQVSILQCFLGSFFMHDCIDRKTRKATCYDTGLFDRVDITTFCRRQPKTISCLWKFFARKHTEILKYLAYYEAAEAFGHNLIDFALGVYTNDHESNGTLRNGSTGRQDIINMLWADNPGSLGFDGSKNQCFCIIISNSNRNKLFGDSSVGFIVNIFYNAILTETQDYYEYNSCTRGNCQLIASVMRLSDAFFRYTFGSNSGAEPFPPITKPSSRTSLLPHGSTPPSSSNVSYANDSSLVLGSNLTQPTLYRLANTLPFHVANLLKPMENGVPAIKNYLDIYGMIAIALLLHFLIPSYMRTLVYERTSGLRVIMKMMGLQTEVYWLVTYLFMLLMFIIFVAIVIVFGIAFNISFFSENYPLTYIGLFFVWGNTCIAFSIFLASILRNPSQALMLGWTYVIVVNFMGFLYITKLVKYHASEELLNFASILPSFAFLRALYFMGKANEAGFAVSLWGATGMCRKPMPCCTVMVFLTVEWAVFLIIGLYIDVVFPHQVSDTPENFDEVVIQLENEFPSSPTSISRISFPLDVHDEQHLSYQGIIKKKPGVYLYQLQKEYSYGILPSEKKRYLALKGLSLGIPAGSCVGLLGRNGAGKTTTVSIMSGLFPPSSGYAYLDGYSVWKDMPVINLLTGVCPQHSILWEDLTVEEHLYFFALLKGSNRKHIKKRVDSLLESVGLTGSRNQVASKLSGGMKRRLCVAIAFAGNPKIVFLDEPSTGLDPLSKHALWKFIEEQKPGRSILLTTHAMDEAERLCDKVGLVTEGTLQCVGDPESLKNRLGVGYRLEITVNMKNIRTWRIFRLNEFCNGKAQLSRNINGHIVFTVPYSAVQLSKVFLEVESLKEEFHIMDWGNLHSLEDVFIRVTENKNDVVDDFRTAEFKYNSFRTCALNRQRTVFKSSCIVLFHINKLFS